MIRLQCQLTYAAACCLRRASESLGRLCDVQLFGIEQTRTELGPPYVPPVKAKLVLCTVCALKLPTWCGTVVAVSASPRQSAIAKDTDHDVGFTKNFSHTSVKINSCNGIMKQQPLALLDV